MKKNNTRKGYLFIALLIVGVILMVSYQIKHPEEVQPKSWSQQKISDFSLSTIYQPAVKLSSATFTGHWSILIFWASWCEVCQAEMPFLMKFKKRGLVDLYSIDFKDDQKSALDFLKKNGDPFLLTGLDKTGDVATNFGVDGTPFLFLIDKNGVIRLRNVGEFNQKLWDDSIAPTIKQFS